MSLSLSAARFGLAEHKRNEWHAVIPEGTDYEAVFDPGFWSHVAGKMRPGDKVTVINDQMTFHAELIVKNAARLWAQVVEISRTELASMSPPDVVSDYQVDVKWAGPHDKFRVERVRGGKKDILASGMDKDAAEKWKAEHLKTIGQKAA
jgi:hypothetical protein